MNKFDKLLWQKKAGILTESEYREAVEEVNEEEKLRKMVREALPAFLNEKKKKTKPKEEAPEEPNTDVYIDNPEGAEGEAPEGGEEMPVEEPQPAGDPAQQVEDGLMTAFEAAGQMGNEKLQTQISNTLTMLQRERLASTKAEAPPAAPAL